VSPSPHSLARLGTVLFGLLLAACRKDTQPEPHRAVDPPVASHNAIPDAPVSGTVRGAPFALRDARYIVDRRVGYAHTDIVLSASKSEAPCGALNPARGTSIWLRLEGDAKIESKDLRINADTPSEWSVHYQVFEGDQWVGLADASAIVTIRGAGPDGRISGGIAVCFSDAAKSCVSGSFDAVSCPPSIDQPVRGTMPPESIPEKYKPLLDAGPVLGGGSPTDAGPLSDAGPRDGSAGG
jgi:hypothetical protein